MTERVISIKIAADGKAFVVETNASATASARLGKEAEKATTSVRNMGQELARQNGQLREVTRNADATASAIAKIGHYGSAIVGLGALGAIAKDAISAADGITTLNSRLALVVGQASQVKSVREEIFKLAQDTRSAFLDMGSTYATFAKSGNDLGISQQRLVTITKAVGQAMAIGGGSAEGMRAAIIQLSQGLASGTLRGEELNSVMEQTPRLAQAIAEGMGITIGQLRAYGAEGKISAVAVMEALEKSAGKLESEFARVQPTVAQAWTTVTNSATMAIGKFDEATGASDKLARALMTIASAIEAVGDTVSKHSTAVSVFVGTIGGAVAVAGIASVGARVLELATKIRVLAAAAGGFGALVGAHPALAVLLGVGAAAGGLYASGEAQSKSVRGLTRDIEVLTSRIASAEATLSRTARGELTEQMEARVVAMRAERMRKQLELAQATAASLDTRVEDRRLSEGVANPFPGAKPLEEVNKYVKLRNDIVQKGYDEAVDMAKAYGARISKETDPAKILELETQRNARMIALDRQTKKELKDYDQAQAKDANDALKLSIDTKIEIYRGADQRVLDDRKAFFDQLKAEEQRGARSSLDVIGATADKEFEVWMQRSAILQAELELVKRKKDSQKEQQEITNKLAAVERDYNQAQQKATNDYEAAMRRRKAAIQEVIEAQRAEDERAYLDELNRQITAQNTLIEGTKAYARSIAEANEMTQLELQMWGATEQARALAIANLQIEIQLRRERERIQASGASAEVKAADLLRAEAAAEQARSGAAARVQIDEWRRTVGTIDSTFRDGFRAMLSRNKDAWKSWTTSLKNTFLSTVADAAYEAFARPFVMQIIGQFMGMTGLTGALAAGAVGSVASAGGAGVLGSLGGLASGMQLIGSNFSAGLATGFGMNPFAGIELGAGLMQSGATAGGLGTIVGSLGPWVAGLAALSALAKATKGETRAGGQYGYAINGTGYSARRDKTYTGLADGAFFMEGPSGGDPFADTVKTAVNSSVAAMNARFEALGIKSRVTGFNAGYEGSEKGRGGVFSGGTTSTGKTFGESGKGDNYAGTLYESTSAQTLSAEQAAQNLAVDLAQSAIQLLQTEMDTLPQWAQAMLKGKVAEQMTGEAANALLQQFDSTVASIKVLTASLNAMPFERLHDLSSDAAYGLAQAAGGFDKLQGALAGYQANFYSETERRERTIQVLTKSFADLGIPMIDLTQGSAKARRAFRDLMDQQDPTTESGQKMIAALLGMQDAFAFATPLVNGLADSMASLTDAASTALDALERSYDAQRKVIQSEIDLRRERVDSARAVVDVARAQAQALLGEVDSGRALMAARGNAFIDQALGAARQSGYLPDATQLGEAVGQARGALDANTYASSFEFTRDQRILAGKLGELEDIGGKQLSTDEQALDFAERQLETLEKQWDTDKAMLEEVRGTAVDVKDMKTAQAVYYAAIAAAKAEKSAGTASGAGAGGGGGGGGGAVFGPGPSTAAPDTKYTRQISIGTAGWANSPVTDEAEIAKLDKVAAINASFNGTGDVAGLLNAVKDAGYSLSDLQAATGFTYTDWMAAAASVGLPRFDRGGDHTGGARLVGESGPEVELTGPSRIFSAEKTSEILGNAPVVAAVDRLTDKVTELLGLSRLTSEDTEQIKDLMKSVSLGINILAEAQA